MKACIIGGGASGVTVAKSLKQYGVAFDWFEKGSALGGLWRYGNDSGTSSAYRSLQIDTSSRSVAYPDFPVPKSWPSYLRARQVLEYLERYARHFGVEDAITTSTEVTAVRRAGSRWEVTTEPGEVTSYDAVIVANGHLSKPKLPEFRGSFDGREMHSHHYRTPEEFSDQRVVVVGMGNSACDISVDIARVASEVHLSTRRSAWILPKYLLGLPTDRWTAFLGRRLKLPTELTRNIVKSIARMSIGPQERFGVPKPAHPIHREHATVSQELLPYVAYGWIQVHQNVESLEGEKVHFADGTSVAADTIIYATGYDVAFPFLEENLVESADRGGRLYRRIAHPEADGLHFAGLVQPVGPTIPLVEIQGRWIANVLSGEITLPDPGARRAEIDEHRAWVKKKFLDSERYRLEVDFKQHQKQLMNDMALAR